MNSFRTFVLVGPSGLEPPTSCLSGTRSNLLSYDPIGFSGFSLGWWRWWDSNPWPPACRAGALPAELHPHKVVVFSFFQASGTVLSVPLTCVGIELFSRTVSRKVSSPLQSLTSVFGMGTGGPSAFVTPTLSQESRFFIAPWILNNISIRFFLRQSFVFRLMNLHSNAF